MTPKRRAEVFLYRNGRCHMCGEKITGPYIVDHGLQLWLGGADELDNLFLHHPDCDKPKTAADAKRRAKTKRQKAKDEGTFAKPKRQIQSKGFDKSRRRKMDGSVVPR